MVSSNNTAWILLVQCVIMQTGNESNSMTHECRHERVSWGVIQHALWAPGRDARVNIRSGPFV